jgi:hypothetical protein
MSRSFISSSSWRLLGVAGQHCFLGAGYSEMAQIHVVPTVLKLWAVLQAVGPILSLNLCRPSQNYFVKTNFKMQ